MGETSQFTPGHRDPEDTGISAGAPGKEPVPEGMCAICRQRKATTSFAGQKICENCGYAIRVMSSGALLKAGGGKE